MKKTLAKILALALCAVLLVTGTVFVTLAYLQSQTGVVKNTFTSGSVKIRLDEGALSDNGKTIDDSKPRKEATVRTENNENVYKNDGNSYFLYPGTTYQKDPMVHIKTDSSPCYIVIAIRNTVFVGDDLASVYGNYTDSGKDDTSIVAQMQKNGWRKLQDTTISLDAKIVTEIGWGSGIDNIEFYYYSTGPLVADAIIDASELDIEAGTIYPGYKSIPIFSEFTIAPNIESITTDESTTLEIIAFAMQSENYTDKEDSTGTITAEANIIAALKAANFFGMDEV